MNRHDQDTTESDRPVRVSMDAEFVEQLRTIRTFAQKMYNTQEPALHALIQQLDEDYAAIVDYDLVDTVDERLEALATMDRYGFTWECPEIMATQWELRGAIERVHQEE